MGDNKCSRDECKLNVYQDEKCVLHCKKKSKYRDADLQLYEDFNNALIDNIAEQLEESSNNEDAIIDKRSAIRFLHGESFQAIFSNDEEMVRLASNALGNIINCVNIIFPPRKSQDNFDYEKVLTKLKAIQFNFCQFNTWTLRLDNITCFFADCTFLDDWSCPPVLKWDRRENIYQACTFKGKVSNYSSIDRNETVSIYIVPLFDYLCTFEKEIVFDNTKFKKPFFYSSVKQTRANKDWLKRLSFKNCIFEEVFKLNNCEEFDFICEDTIFVKKSKFEFKDNKLENFELENTNFKVLVDCFHTEFKSFEVKKSIFEKFTGFEQCKFGEKENSVKKAIFQYATFLDFVNFRDAKFHNGLDLRNANFKEIPNFLDVYIEAKNTNRETFRIIKYSFDSVGNTIEANKFFTYEMDKERQSISWRDSKSKYLALQLNYYISNFGQSWLTPFFLILYFLVLQYLVFCLMDNWQIENKALRTIWVEINNSISYFMPFKKFLVEGKEFVSLFFLIIYSTLIYNLIIAVKRITKR